MARACVCAAVLISVASLGAFKYAGLLAELYNAIPFLPDVAVPQIALPTGISFYTFQAMSYTIDVYRRDAPAQRNLVNFGVYVTLFPQLIAGPIVHYKDVAGQINGERVPLDQFALGIRQFLVGLSKKVLIANQMGLCWDMLRAHAAANGTLAAWVGVAAYSFQIYFDFSGYSDMALGLGNMLGFRFMRNFDYPYVSRSITEFWRRWHISLSTWFRDYVYIPLGGSRVAPVRMYFNLFAVWFLTGLWHGASLNFVAWGLYYFVILALEKRFLLKRLERLPDAARHAYALLLVMLGWALFYFDAGMGDCLRFLGAMFGGAECFVSGDALNVILRYLPLMAVAAVACTPLGARTWRHLERWAGRDVLEIALCAGALLLCAAALSGQSYNPFLYFKF